MSSTNMGTAYPLTNSEISNAITRKSAGVYALGHETGTAFYVDYVGRSDSDLAECLKEHAKARDYSCFKFMYSGSPEVAFEEECELYHDFNPPGNIEHPDHSNLSPWHCHRCLSFS
ncbi:hypothetical protein FAI40_10195 [Acetobacteraceae bacterium]|nr:hypothetical protein FAI40_10195 [Acetobacteraceae bacterium]